MNVERDVSNSWIGKLKFFIEGKLYHYVGRITWTFFDDLKGGEIKDSQNTYSTSIRTFEFKKMYLIQMTNQCDIAESLYD
jgi:hypothetical protein